MKAEHTGAWGEIYAARFLRESGYDIFSANYRTRFGEIDIIAFDGEYVVFAEVKTRGKNMIASPSAAVDRGKRKRLSAAASEFIAANRIKQMTRFDVIEVFLSDDGKPDRINHIKAAFDGEF